jgi:hypothetical protein
MMCKKGWMVAIMSLAAAGCATRLPQAAPGHPAHPETAEAPMAPPSETLTVTDPVQPPPPMRHHMHGHGRMQGGTERGDYSTTSRPSAHVVYTCSMHPKVTADKAGTCPICGMDLVPQQGGG